MHLDLKSANILLARDGTAKLADVGLAKILTRDNTFVSMEGTFDWAAPEVSSLVWFLPGLPVMSCTLWNQTFCVDPVLTRAGQKLTRCQLNPLAITCLTHLGGP